MAVPSPTCRIGRHPQAARIFITGHFAAGIGREEGLGAPESYLRIKCITTRLDR